MATVTAEINLSSNDLLTDVLSLNTSVDLTASSASGLSRKTITSTAKGTSSGQVELAPSGVYTSPNYIYIKNTDTTSTDYVTVYDDAGGDVDILYIPGGGWAFLPIMNGQNLKAYAATSGTVVEFMVFGTEA
tara:strand:+ start:218 stop:613 length:396 start_codon:yes stop_codon:yes gene_type:complete